MEAQGYGENICNMNNKGFISRIYKKKKNRHNTRYTKEGIQLANKHMKIYSTSSINRKLKIKTTMGN